MLDKKMHLHGPQSWVALIETIRATVHDLQTWVSHDVNLTSRRSDLPVSMLRWYGAMLTTEEPDSQSVTYKKIEGS